MTTDSRQFTHLVVDAGAIIKGVQLQAKAKNFWTTEDVLNEIRDKQSRQFLRKLPFELQVKEPSDEAIRVVSDFAKKTGDFPFLSLPDIRIMALTYQLEKQEVGIEHLRKVPPPKKTVVKGSKNGQTSVAWMGDRASTPCRFLNTKKGCRNGDNCPFYHEMKPTVKDEMGGAGTIAEKVNSSEEVDGVSGAIIDEVEGNQNVAEDLQTAPSKEIEHKSRIMGFSNASVASSSVDDNGGNWVTAENFHHYLDSPFGSGSLEEEDASELAAGCITTDYSMQNVLLQMGLRLLSTEGRSIRQVKQWVLQCVACFTLVTDTGRLFCPKCGNSTLDRISCSVDSKTGQMRLFTRANRPMKLRGTKYSIPVAKGGRDQGLLLREDQLLMGQWAQKAQRSIKKKNSNAFSDDFNGCLGMSSSRRDPLVVGFGRRNPNAQKGRERRGKKKKN